MEIAQYHRLTPYLYRFEKPVLHPNPGEVVYERLPQEGTVYTWTVIERDHAPAGFENMAPYVEAIVEGENEDHIKKRFTVQLTDLPTHEEEMEIDGQTRTVTVFDVYIGMPVEMVTRKKHSNGDEGIIIYGPSFRPPINSELSVPPSTSNTDSHR